MWFLNRAYRSLPATSCALHESAKSCEPTYGEPKEKTRTGPLRVNLGSAEAQNEKTWGSDLRESFRQP